MTLNINSKTLFLTYSQVNQHGIDRFVSSPSDHFDFVSSALGTPTRYRLARESHQDGGHHFHAYIGFESAVRIRSASRLDFGCHHPNIQSVRTGHRRTWDYVGKDGDIIYETGDPPDPVGGPSGDRGDTVWGEAVRAESEEEFYSILRNGAPRYYILYHRQLEQYAAKFYGVRPEPYRSPTFTDLTGPRIAEWKDQATIGFNGSGHRRRSLILWGPTRTGKTANILAGNHVYWHSYFNISDFDENADYAVFDDIAGGFQYFPNYKGWLGAQKTFTVTDKYRAKKRIEWGKPCIMLMNDDPTFDSHVDTAWLLGNCHIIFVPENEPIVQFN
ncbi:replication associated protein [Chicken genomovirus mg7_70]|nr:replication associated protein [Chicken genomovirus mg7_70]